MHRSKSEFRALRLVLGISPSSDFGIMHHFFHGLLILQGKFCQNFIIFLNRLTGPQSFSLDRMHGSKSEFGALELVLAISPSSDLGIMNPFFSWTSYYSGKILSKFHNFSQPVQLVGIWFNRFIELACMEHWFWWFWSLIPTWLGSISSRSFLG